MNEPSLQDDLAFLGQWITKASTPGMDIGQSAVVIGAWNRVQQAAASTLPKQDTQYEPSTTGANGQNVPEVVTE